MSMLLFVLFGENTVLKIFKTSHMMSMCHLGIRPAAFHSRVHEEEFKLAYLQNGLDVSVCPNSMNN